MSRLFVAVAVPAEVREHLDAALDETRRRHDGLRWTPPEQWHVTLAFIGSVDVPSDEVLDTIHGAVAVAPASVHLELTEAGRFGDRVLWYGLRDDPDGAVAELGGDTQHHLASAGLPVDERPVRPHITLARARGRGRGKVRRATVEDVPHVDASWTVHEVVLYGSVRQGHGEPNRYEVRGRLPLGGG